MLKAFIDLTYHLRALYKPVIKFYFKIENNSVKVQLIPLQTALEWNIVQEFVMFFRDRTMTDIFFK